MELTIEKPTTDFNVAFFVIGRLGQTNFNCRTIIDHYLPEKYYISGPFMNDFLADNQIGYIRFPGFTGEIDKHNLNFMLERYQDTQGLIIDLRQNGGGMPQDMYRLLSRFVSEKTLIYYSQLKNGPGHDDFGSPKPAYVEPYEGIRYLKPMRVLPDRGTYSAGSFTSLVIKAIPNMLLVGDTTGGGLGAPNGGQLPNGWRYRFSISKALTLDMDESYENGVPPDMLARFDWSDLSRDEVLDAAISDLLR
ncbi:MAG: S41 family peptidase [Cytophagales bacterium]|nr:S41 family peptidase [Cytophagales bacterium]